MNELVDREDEDIMTPDALAWKLLLDDGEENEQNEKNNTYRGGILPFLDEQMSMYDKTSCEFEILCIMYMEMVFGLLKINHMNTFMNEDGEITEDDDDKIEKSFKPDLSTYKVDDLSDLFKKKFLLINYYLSVSIIDPELNDFSQNEFGFENDYYWKIILRDVGKGNEHFEKHKQTIDPTKRYTFMFKSNKKGNQKELKDFYTVCALPNFKVKISFSKLKIHTT